MADETCPDVSQKTREHDLFKPFVGEFRAEVRLFLGPGDPMVTHGVMRNELDLGGRYLRQHFTGDEADGPFPNFEGRGYWGYNTLLGRFEGFWIDTASTFMSTESGEVDADGRTWTMLGESTNPETGGSLKKRTVVALVDDDHHTMDTWFEPPEHGEFKAMEIRYERLEPGSWSVRKTQAPPEGRRGSRAGKRRPSRADARPRFRS